ncbi:FecR family protein [Pedobacter nyackensis]|uniref:FecR family protein n=1 Tax=Pedobacter nyackensis TaxID=475255 RepID=UPI00292D323C|nr:FecR domain-containing protein [Pedobacter nyackensis]
MENKSADKLLEKYSQGSCTDEEKAIVESWYLSASGNADDSDLAVPDFEKADRKLQSELGLVPKETIKLWPRIAIAASVLLVCGASLIFYLNNINREKSLNASVMNDVTPGINNATLTLANGQKIILDNAANGKIAEQAGVSVSKTADGQIMYSIKDLKNTGKADFNTLSTANGEQYQIILPDGTKVWLNAATSLKFPLTFAGLSQRKVTLIGEAYFEVYKDKKKPFIVHSAQQDVEVLGTHFNINAYKDEPTVKTTLLEGAVKVNTNYILKPGEQFTINQEGKAGIKLVNVEDVIAWKKGNFEFNDENVYEIMRKVARWYDVEVIYEDQIPLTKMEGTMSRFQNVSRILDVLERTGILSFKIEGKKIYISKA